MSTTSRQRRALGVAVLAAGALLVLSRGLAAPGTPKPADPRDPKRFLEIPQWYVSYMITIEGQGRRQEGQGPDAGHTDWRIARLYRGQYSVMNRLPNAYLWTDAMQPSVIDLGRYIGWGPRVDQIMKPESYLKPLQIVIGDQETSTGLDVGEGIEPHWVSHTTTWKGTAEKVGGARVCYFSADTTARRYSVLLPYRMGNSADRKLVRSAENEADQFGSVDWVQLPDCLGRKGYQDGYLAENQPLPDEGNDIVGEADLRGQIGAGGWGTHGDVKVHVSWNCTPHPQLASCLWVEPEDPEEYEKWRPEGPRQVPAQGGQPPQDQPGNSLRVKAYLTGGNGLYGDVEPPVKAGEIRFELVNVSREKGVAINWPVNAAADAKPDFGFDSLKQPRGVLVVGEDRQIAHDVSMHLTEAEAVISAYDFGAYGELKVSAHLDTGQWIVGHVALHPEQETLLLPKRSPDSFIADQWKIDHQVSGQKDDADEDNFPIGDGVKGDGLTLYEEYRGYFGRTDDGAGLQWSDLDPTRKNFFVYDTIHTARSATGLNLFKQLSKLRVIENLTVTEASDAGVVNFNHTRAPHIVDQHMVTLQQGDFPHAWCHLNGIKQPGTPADWPIVTVGTGIEMVERDADGQLRDDFACEIAHALLHACHVRDHGDRPYKAMWVPMGAEEGGGVTGVLELRGKELTPIKVLYEDGTTVPPVRLPWKNNGGFDLLVGSPGDACSGDENCVMRCYEARAYVSPGNPLVRYWIKEPFELPGYRLCTSPVGTGINQPPKSRHGDAVSPYGNCAGQIRVTDRRVE